MIEENYNYRTSQTLLRNQFPGKWFMAGYNEMLRRIEPEKIICYIIAEALILPNGRIEVGVVQIERYLKRKDSIARNRRIIDFQMACGNSQLIAWT